MKRLRFAVLVLLLAAAAPTAVWAHPLGNFTVNRYSRIEPAGDGVRIVYVLDMAEIPTFQEQPRIDADRDGQVAERERDQYADSRAEEIRRNLELTLNGARTDLRLLSRSLSFPEGQGGLSTLRLEAVYNGALPSGARESVDLTYRDNNEPTRIGWREIVARPAAVGTQIQQASVPADDKTNELRSYPDDLLSSPLDVRQARLTFTPGAASADPLATLGVPIAERTRDVYASLASAEDLSPMSILFLLGLAMFLGAGHALSPGHGKTVVAAYLVGSRGTAKHALFLGATVTATHTAGVYALGLVTLYLSQYILPERLYPFLELISGVLVIVIGIWLFASRLRLALRSQAHPHGADFSHAHDDATGHVHDHDHDHASAPEPAYAYAHGPAVIESGHAPETGPSHGHADAHRPVHNHGAYDHDHDDAHGHEHGRAHDHGPHDHDHGSHGHDHDHADAGGHGAVHSHGGTPHSHVPPGADGQPVTWRSLLALGVSGGLLPCPSALVVLLSAIALHRVLFGLALIVAFSIGLAAVLTGIGLLLVYARRLLQRLSFRPSLATRLLPAISALAVVVAGIAITLQALPQIL